MSDAEGLVEARQGDVLVGDRGSRIGRVDAVFADYLLVRTHALLPVDLYVPRTAVSRDARGRLAVEQTGRAAYEAWHRPLKRAPHD